MLVRQSVRLVRRRPWSSALLCACAVAALAACARVLAPSRLDTDAEFPRVRAAQLAHLLADISAHTLSPGWSLEDEASNYTSWRYSVSYACGARCSGHAAVEAHERSREHRVVVVRRHCTRPLLLPLPLLCDEIETESIVTAVGTDEEGAHLRESSRATCSVLSALLRRCTSAAELRLTRAAHLQRLRALLSACGGRLAA